MQPTTSTRVPCRSPARRATIGRPSSDSSAVTAPLTDSSLVNGWGLTASGSSPWWTANNKTNTSTLYTGGGAKNTLTVTVSGGPTGTVANGNSSDFVIGQSGTTASA